MQITLSAAGHVRAVRAQLLQQAQRARAAHPGAAALIAALRGHALAQCNGVGEVIVEASASCVVVATGSSAPVPDPLATLGIIEETGDPMGLDAFVDRTHELL